MAARKATIGLATIVVIGLVGGFLFGGGLVGSDSAQSQAGTEYPEDIMRISQQVADHLADGDRILLRETDDGPELYIRKPDKVLSGAALRAAARGLPYDPADLLAPVHDAAGEVVGYSAPNVPQLLSRDAVDSPDFDLCALQVEANQHAREVAPKELGELPPFKPIC